MNRDNPKNFTQQGKTIHDNRTANNRNVRCPREFTFQTENEAYHMLLILEKAHA